MSYRQRNFFATDNRIGMGDMRYPVSRGNHVSEIASFLSFCAAIVLIALGAQAQQPAIPTTGFAGLDQYRASRIAVFTDDYGQLARYREANAALKAPAPGENRVVFFGDSITDIWKLEDSFPASLTSTAASADRPRRRCWCASARM